MNFSTLKDLEKAAGQSLGTTHWHEVTQEQIDRYSEATGDYQWIHTDVERARKESPFGGTIAHGYLVLSLLGPFMLELLAVDSARMALNYGLNRVRFTGHVPAGSRVRMQATLISVEDYQGIGKKLTLGCEVSREGTEKPVLVAEALAIVFE